MVEKPAEVGTTTPHKPLVPPGVGNTCGVVPMAAAAARVILSFHQMSRTSSGGLGASAVVLKLTPESGKFFRTELKVIAQPLPTLTRTIIAHESGAVC